MRSAHLLPLLAASALGAQMSNSLGRGLLARQSECPDEEIVCGGSCIDLTDDCCPDGSFCLVGTECWLGDNNVYGCCDLGQVCGGDAAQTTIGGGSAPEPTDTAGSGDLSSFNAGLSSIDSSLNSQLTSLGQSTLNFNTATNTGFGFTPTATGGSGAANTGAAGGATGGGHTVTHMGGVGGLIGSGAGAMQTAAAVAAAAFVLL